MNDMSQAAGIGHNNPPLSEVLGEKYRDAVANATELLAAAEKTPNVIDNDQTAEDVADLVKKLQASENELTGAMDAEKAPLNQLVTQINGFFRRWIDKVEPTKKNLKKRNADYKAKKDAEVKRKAEEEAAAKRAEEEKKRREAADAETTAAASRAALAEFQRLEKEATEAKASAHSEQELAQAEVSRCESVLARVKYDNATLAASFAERVVKGNPATDEEKAEKRSEADSRLKAAKTDLEAARNLLAEARERAKQAREAARKAEEEAAAKKAETERAERDQRSAEREADRVGRQAQKIESKLDAGEINSGGIRSIHGALQTSQRAWKCQVTDRNSLDKDALWNLIHGDAIDVAVRKWMMLQPEDKRQMPGALFWEEDVAMVR